MRPEAAERVNDFDTPGFEVQAWFIGFLLMSWAMAGGLSARHVGLGRPNASAGRVDIPCGATQRNPMKRTHEA
jgi:hypothetical protein